MKNLNKSTKIWLNYVIGGTISVLMLWGIWTQISKQLARVGPHPEELLKTGHDIFLWICIILMPINLALEAKKWHLLARSAQKLSYRAAFTSYIAGIAFATVTPNRLGEYPGRILYLKRKNTIRLISVSILGAMAQMLTLFIWGLAGLIYYNLFFDDFLGKVVLIPAIIIAIILFIAYWKFETWIPIIERLNFKWLKRFNIYSKLLKRFTFKEQLTILGISMLRYSIYTAQYLFLLYWMSVNMSPMDGFFTCALFFWVVTIIPSLTIIELGERGFVGIYLFQHFSDNTVGILAATVGIWIINLAIPSLLGSLLLFRMRLIR